MRSIKHIHTAVNAPIHDLITYRAMPTQSIDHIDPFLFLNHHGPQDYKAANNGLPFGPHPHRGFETLTFIFEGDLMHWDSGGGKSVIREGGIQWMTAGSGLIHAEISSDEFKAHGGRVEIIQLWINLPQKHKMISPKYLGFQKDEIPLVELEDGNVQMRCVSGELNNNKGPVNPVSDINIGDIRMKKGGKWETFLSTEHNILFYIVQGEVVVNANHASMHQLVEFENDHEQIVVSAREDSLIIFGHAKPFNEPIVAQGPFVMNSEAEIRQAYLDYQQGKMGRWE